MTDAYLAHWRLAVQRITRQVDGDPAAVVRWLGAVQAQDYLAGLWAVGLRTRDCTEAKVEQAIADRTIVRTHFMRNTVHLVPPEDLRWMMRLVAPRIRMIIDNIARQGKLGLDESVYAKSNEIIAKALVGGNQMTRPQLAKLLEEAGIATEGRLTLITQRAQTDGIMCHSVRKGAQYGLALVDDWLPPGRDLTGEEALAEFARLYFRGHGPATLQDYAWWSGLTL
ncbi:MAG TPA: winged helix DNA-binding domain-containing protein, partial [Candidatus Limnocylindrales bacterium]